MRHLMLLTYLVILNTSITYTQTIFHVSIKQPPKLELLSEKDTLVELGESIELGNIITVSGGTIPYSYLWTPATGLSDENSQNPSVTPYEDIKYYLIVKDNNNCTVKDSIQINIKVSTNITETIVPEITIYPVPVTNDIFYIRLMDIKKPLNFSILDIKGKVIKQDIIAETEGNTILQIPLHVQPGIYILKIECDNISVAKKFIVIQN